MVLLVLYHSCTVLRTTPPADGKLWGPRVALDCRPLRWLG